MIQFSCRHRHQINIMNVVKCKHNRPAEEHARNATSHRTQLIRLEITSQNVDSIMAVMQIIINNITVTASCWSHLTLVYQLSPVLIFWIIHQSLGNITKSCTIGLILILENVITYELWVINISSNNFEINHKTTKTMEINYWYCYSVSEIGFSSL